MMLRKLLSYFVPVNILKRDSDVSTRLEITYNNGKLVLDSKNTNYSYGSLQRILKKGLHYIGFDRIKNFEHILVLGVAGGSVIKTLTEDIGYKGKITGVEIDPKVIDLANKYFNLDKIPGCTIVIEDAFEFVLKSKDSYDLIIIDIFKDTVMPAFLFESFFIDKINQILKVNGFILFNTMTLTNKDKERNTLYRSFFNSDYSVRLYPKVEDHNELFTIKKLR